ncbi:MAG TPA: ribonuclease III [Chloroflexota bacterium]|nr:ribonuclease III [Chloroflexota bacterium]
MPVHQTAERSHGSQATLERALGYTFSDHGLLRQALTHRSYVHEHPDERAVTNERLEFLGDAIFQFFVSDTLYRRFPNFAEGQLTALRAAVVSTQSFAAVGERLGLTEHVRVSRGEAALEGRGRASILAGCVEALVAAVYLDAGEQGEREAKALVERLMEERITAAGSEDAPVNVKGRLQELVQAQRGITPVYRVVDHDGPDHARRFEVEVLAGNEPLGRGRGIGKREAENSAARAALEALDAR